MMCAVAVVVVHYRASSLWQVSPQAMQHSATRQRRFAQQFSCNIHFNTRSN